MINLYSTLLIRIITIVFFIVPKGTSAQIKVGSHAPDVNITDWIKNTPFEISLKDKFVVIDFWATWCAPCLGSMAHMNKLVEENKTKDNLVFLAMSDEKKEKIMPLLSRVSFKAAVVTDTSGQTQNDYEIDAIPECVIIDDKGFVQWTGNPAQLTNDIIQKILERQKVTIPKVEELLLDSDRERYDSLKQIHKSIFSNENVKEYFNVGLFSKAQGGFSVSNSTAKSLQKMETGVRLCNLIANEFSVGINQISLPEDINRAYISYCYKSEKNIIKRNILDSILAAMRLVFNKSDSVQKVFVIEVIDSGLFSKSKVENQRNNDNRHLSVSDNEDFMAIGNSFFTDMMPSLQSRFDCLIILKDPSSFKDKLDIVLQTESFESFQKSLRFYGLDVKQQMQILPYITIRHK
jgi:thiol-disulfide isomerase/thioredoxin